MAIRLDKLQSQAFPNLSHVFIFVDEVALVPLKA